MLDTMLPQRITPVVVFLIFIGLRTPLDAEARIWTSATGDYTIDAELIAFDDRHVVLKREDSQLGQVPLTDLSQADRDYLATKEASQIRSDSLEAMQTWTMQDGLRVVGRVVDYGRQEMTIQRRRGKIYVNDRVFENLPQVYQHMVPRIVAHFEQVTSADQRGFEAWVMRLRGQPKSFALEGVVLELENGDEYRVPFFFFSDKDQRLLKAGWNEWLAANESYDQQANESFKLQSLAAAMQRDAQVDREIAMMQLNMQAIEAGITSAWEVTLYPAAGNPSPPRWVVVPGRNTAQATAAAVSQNPGFVAGPVRRVSR